MATVNFYMKKKEESTGKSLIYLQLAYNNKKLVYSFGQRINPKDWNKNKQRVKSNLETTADGKYSLNDLLDNLALVCEQAYNKEIKNGIPEPGTLKKYLDDFMNQNKPDESMPTLTKLIERFISGEIKHEGKSKSPNTIKTYRTFQGHLNKFQEHFKKVVDFESVTLDFYYKYLGYLETEFGLGQNAISKDIQILKVIMGEAVDLGYTNNLQFKHKKFAVRRKETDSVYLKEDELIKLYNHDLSGDKRLEEMRDLFVFGAFVGLRFSDYSEIKPEYIVKENGEFFIKMRTKKTGELVIIPCNPIVLQIFEKYDQNPNKLPKVPGNTPDSRNALFNRYIKEVCKAAEFKEKGRLVSEPELELWQCIESHTARRSFATNLYLSGFPTVEIMKITGHRTEKAFMTYIKVSKLDAAKRLSQHIKNEWSKKLLRVA